ncbi:MAG: carboxymuconolactone decarboxylase family protein [Gammaproteobacteria bacterium]|nr:carboxymuconolactone decarboxylase family protein [Gammaproteobacteria bacterium]
MTREYPIYDAETAPAEAKPLLEGVISAYGFIPNSLGVMAASPPVLEAYLSLSALLEKTTLTDRERFVVMLAASRAAECAYCVPAVSTLAKMQGAPAGIVERIRDERPLDDPRLEALRRLATRMVRKQGRVSEEDIGEFVASGHTHPQVFEVLLISLTKLLAIYVNHAVGTPLDEAFQPERWTAVA